MKIKLIAPKPTQVASEREIEVSFHQEKSGKIVILAGMWYIAELVIEDGKLKLFRHKNVGSPEKIATGRDGRIELTEKYQDQRFD
jgi:hypothetical protein